MPNFHPNVRGALPSIWYRVFENSGRARNMWSIWFIYYMHVNKLFSVYSNLAIYTGLKQSSLVVNRLEAGLHYRKRPADVHRLLTVWKDDYAMCPVEPSRLDWDGSYIPGSRQY